MMGAGKEEVRGGEGHEVPGHEAEPAAELGTPRHPTPPEGPVTLGTPWTLIECHMHKVRAERRLGRHTVNH